MRVLVDGYLRGRLTFSNVAMSVYFLLDCLLTNNIKPKAATTSTTFHMVRPSVIFAKGWKRRAKAAKVMASGLTDFS